MILLSTAIYCYLSTGMCTSSFYLGTLFIADKGDVLLPLLIAILVTCGTEHGVDSVTWVGRGCLVVVVVKRGEEKR